MDENPYRSPEAGSQQTSSPEMKRTVAAVSTNRKTIWVVSWATLVVVATYAASRFWGVNWMLIITTLLVAQFVVSIAVRRLVSANA